MLRLTDGMSEWWFRAGLEYPTVAVFAFFAVFVFGANPTPADIWSSRP